jgi:hypothetical protein
VSLRRCEQFTVERYLPYSCANPSGIKGSEYYSVTLLRVISTSKPITEASGFPIPGEDYYPVAISFLFTR